MTVFTKYTAACEICKKKLTNLLTGFENWTIVEHYQVKSLCKDCSTAVKEFIVLLKKGDNKVESRSNYVRCPNCGELVDKREE